MSLLMKALEKAAQDRNKTPVKPAAATPSASAASGTPVASSALSLEPLEPTLGVAPAGAPREAPGAATVTTASTPSRAASRSGEQARASVLLSSQPARSASGGAAGAAQWGQWISTHPVPFTAALAGAFALVYGTYIYLQAAHPGLFLRTPPPPPASLVAAKPAPVTPVPATPAPVAQNTPSTDTALIPAQSVFSSKPVTPGLSASESPVAGTGTGAMAAKSPPAPSTSSPPITAPAAASAAPAVAAAVTPQARIVVSRGDNAAPRVNPVVSDAYAALEAGRFDAARRLYEQAARSEPNNIDALLGLAAIARHENRTDDASKHYLKILDIDPRHALAQTGLIALLGRADPQAAETRLKQLAARDPSPALYFTLGNLYADQGQWSQAQQAYFQAHHLDAGNPDYAYNLAVALEHLGQQKLSLGFYRRAVQLAAGRGRSNFDPSQAQARITQLAARLE